MTAPNGHWPCVQKFYEVNLHNGLQFMKLAQDSDTMNEWPANRLPLALPEMRQICEVLRQVRQNQDNMSK